MNFQEYSQKIDQTQKITAEKAMVLTFSNSKGEAFTIAPADIKSFLEFFINNYATVKSKWQGALPKKSLISKYEEKPYREIYKADPTLKPINSSGGSQTKALSMLIAKLIAYLTDQSYQKVEINTFFDKDSLKAAIKNWDRLNSDLNVSPISSLQKEEIRKTEFYKWMLTTGLSEKTAKSYSNNGIDFSNETLQNLHHKITNIYSASSVDMSDIQTVLENSIAWIENNNNGHNMYSSALKKYEGFLNDLNKTKKISKPFLLLAGISGTGKSRFVREQARLSSSKPEEVSKPENYELVSVRPDWHEPSDLLGYVTRLSGKPEFVSTEVLRFIVKAWKEISENNAKLADNFKSGDFEFKKGVKPFWLCLDEMNLAPVEQYFADYLSVLETRNIFEEGGEKFYSCDPLIKASDFEGLFDGSEDDAAKNVLAKSLGLTSSDELFNSILKYGIPLPYNLIVAGTVNMDETTHGFSRKVIDRALTFDFGEFFPNDFDKYGSKDFQPKSLSYPTITHITEIDINNQRLIETREFLKQVNSVLKGTMFELAYRALNEALVMVESFNPSSEAGLCAVWDDFLMMKVLPRIEGDEDKLAYITDVTDDKSDATILDKLIEILDFKTDANANQTESTNTAEDQSDAEIDASLKNFSNINGLSKKMLHPIWEDGRPDLLRDGAANIPCRSKQKLEWMRRKLIKNGFTAFWP